MEQLVFRAMGCQMLAALDSPSPRAQKRLARVPRWFERWEQHLSRFRADSELSRLNRSAGRPTQVSETLWLAARAALRAARASGGLVVPTLLEALEASGYDRSFGEMPAHGTSSGNSSEDGVAVVAESGEVLAAAGSTGVSRAREDERARRPRSQALRAEQLGEGSGQGVDEVAWRGIVADPVSRTLRLPEGVRLDLGGIAKGWAVDRAAQRLGSRAPALVDAGGDIAVSGPPTEGPGWPIGIADPTTPDRQLALLCLRRGGVATSGRDYRRWQRNGRWQHHILDPRTGHPAATDVLSATVIAPSAEQAEVAAKVALILGSQEGLAWLEARRALAGLLVCEDGRVLGQRLDAYIWR